MTVNPLQFLRYDQKTLTPEEIAYQKELAAALMPQTGARNVGEGVVNIGKGLVAGLLLRRAISGTQGLAAQKQQQQAEGQRLAQEALGALTGGGGAATGAPAHSYPVRNAAEKPDFGKVAKPVGGGMSPYRRALLDAIAGKESAGRYDVIYGGKRIADLSRHPGAYVPIKSGPNKGKKSSAAGRYQFLASTWKQYAKKLGLKDFSPASQDAAAWALAADTYKAKTGEDLDAVLRSGDQRKIAQVGNVLSGIWTSLPGGIEQGQGANQFVRAYQTALQRQAGGKAPQQAPRPVAVRVAQADSGTMIDSAPAGAEATIAPAAGEVGATYIAGKDNSRILPDGTEVNGAQLIQQAQQAAGNGMIDPRALKALSSPYVSKEQKALIRQLIEYKLRQSQPQNIVIGNKLVDKRTGRVIGDYAAPPQPTTLERQYERAKREGYKGSFIDYQRDLKAAGAAKTNVNVNTGTQQPMPGLSKLPPGYTYLYDNDGKVRLDERGMPIVAPIPGTPAADKEKQTKIGRKKSASYSSISMDEIGRALGILNSDKAGIPSTGLAGSVASAVPGTTAYQLKTFLDTIKANVGFERLNAMRQSSPTGGALGQVTERELKFLQSAAGSLDQAQNKEELIYNLNRLNRLIHDVVNYGLDENGRPRIQPNDGGQPASSGSQWKTLPGGVKIRKVR